MSRASFDALAAKITREYERKGFARPAARYIGKATAGKVATEKHRRAKAKR